MLEIVPKEDRKRGDRFHMMNGQREEQKYFSTAQEEIKENVADSRELGLKVSLLKNNR